MKHGRALVVFTVLIIIMSAAVTLTGLLYSNGGAPFDFRNQYGDTVKIYGQGLYAGDSYFKAPIFRGTDLTMLVVAIPLLLVAMLIDLKKKTVASRLFHTSVILVFAYYSAGLAFGVTYNFMILAYIALFSLSVFGMFAGLSGLDYNKLPDLVDKSMKHKAGYVFLVLTGLALSAAWLPDIFTAMAAGRPLALIENYTTEITYVLDMGLIAPAAFLAVWALAKRRGIGYVILGLLATLCIVVGIMLPVQTLFQAAAGIEIPPQVMVFKIASFVALALFALLVNIRLLRHLKG